jgi:hypothetical protein
MTTDTVTPDTSPTEPQPTWWLDTPWVVTTIALVGIFALGILLFMALREMRTDQLDRASQRQAQVAYEVASLYVGTSDRFPGMTADAAVRGWPADQDEYEAFTAWVATQAAWPTGADLAQVQDVTYTYVPSKGPCLQVTNARNTGHATPAGTAPGTCTP